MQRETKEYETTKGTKYEIKTFLTAREVNEIRLRLTGDKEVGMESGEMKAKGSELIDSQNFLIETAIVSYNGSTEKILDRLLDGNVTEFNEIALKAADLLKGNLV